MSKRDAVLEPGKSLRIVRLEKNRRLVGCKCFDRPERRERDRRVVAFHSDGNLPTIVRPDDSVMSKVMQAADVVVVVVGRDDGFDVAGRIETIGPEPGPNLFES
jgi:hypothetical protein